jgi:hypothetical protein
MRELSKFIIRRVSMGVNGLLVGYGINVEKIEQHEQLAIAIAMLGMLAIDMAVEKYVKNGKEK